jgi:hypothetical protein
MIKNAFNLLFILLVTIFSADLLYLWVGGAWYDPIKIIEMIEVVILSICCAGGLIYFSLAVRKLGKK